jgi:uncharacterized protein DUF1045
VEATTPKPFVFVLMPFSQEFADIYEFGIKPACSDAGALCERADEQISVGNILECVYEQIATADIIVAEMTGRNPNVFYEVGYAHALNKPVILLTRNTADIPFNLTPYQHIIYGGSIAILKKQLEAKVRWCIQNPQKAVVPSPHRRGKRIFALSESSEFQTYLQGLMLEGKHAKLSGVGLNIIQRDVFATKLFRYAAEGHCQLEILLSDPFSPAVEMRLIEEERGKIDPPIGQDGLVRRLDTLLRMWRDLGCPDSIKIKLTANYLTFALMIVDSEYFVYPYGYANLGNFSPVFRFSRNELADKEVIGFLDEHYNRLSEDAPDAELAIQVRNNTATRRELLHTFALYFIPPENSDLYQLGSKILGYDIRKGESITSAWEEMIGGAGQFGFHLTLCDALYFLNEAEVKSAVAEVKFLFRKFNPFDLTNLRIKSAFPDATSISVAMDERSGSLEALHHELVHRINRRAAASYYTLGLAKPVRDMEYDRAQFMMRRYRSPYILQRFLPHFSLLTNVPPNDRERIYQDVNQLFTKNVQDRTIHVERIAIMSRPDLNSPWVIQTEVEL